MVVIWETTYKVCCVCLLVSCSPDRLLASIFIIMTSCGRLDVIIIEMEARSGSGLRETICLHCQHTIEKYFIQSYPAYYMCVHVVYCTCVLCTSTVSTYEVILKIACIRQVSYLVEKHFQLYIRTYVICSCTYMYTYSTNCTSCTYIGTCLYPAYV